MTRESPGSGIDSVTTSVDALLNISTSSYTQPGRRGWRRIAESLGYVTGYCHIRAPSHTRCITRSPSHFQHLSLSKTFLSCLQAKHLRRLSVLWTSIHSPRTSSDRRLVRTYLPFPGSGTIAVIRDNAAKSVESTSTDW